jgi:phosphoribosylanthranilate isomerase
MAVEAGADAIGMIFAPSPRQIGLETAREIALHLPERVEAVGVFADPSQEELDAVLAAVPRMTLQFSGSEAPVMVAHYGGRAIKAIHVNARGGTEVLEAECARYPHARVLFDTFGAGLAGGTGKTFAWERVAPIAQTRDVIVAGGLKPENVDECVRSARPFGVDVRTGIETDGRKDLQKMRAFERAVRAADAA